MLDGLLVTFLFLRLVSLLDDGLKLFIATEGIGDPKRHDLYNRIELLAETDQLQDKAGLHRLRERRREVAHESHPTSVDWSTLDESLNQVEIEFRNGQDQFRCWWLEQ